MKKQEERLLQLSHHYISSSKQRPVMVNFFRRTSKLLCVLLLRVSRGDEISGWGREYKDQAMKLLSEMTALE